MERRVFGGLFAVLLATSLGACGGTTEPTLDDPRFVGTWDADSLTLTNDAPPNQVANLLDTTYSGSFVIVVEPSGQYTATLTVFGQSSPEIGQLTVTSSSTLTLAPSFPPGRPAASASYSFQGDGDLTLEGPSEFDFNFDGIDESVQAYTHLVRR